MSAIRNRRSRLRSISWQKLFGTSKTKKARSIEPTRLALEECEARRLLAVFTVTSPLDTGAVGELRWAVSQANTTAGHDTINFDVGDVALAQGELTITDAVTIDGSSVTPVLVNISAAPNSRIFRVDDSNPNTNLPVDLVQLQLRGGDVSSFIGGQGGAILNHERLDFRLSIASENTARAGGNIANHGDLLIEGSDITGGTATGAGGGGLYAGQQSSNLIVGSGFLGNEAPNGSGGAVFGRTAVVTISADSLVQGNSAGVNGGGLAAIGGTAVDLQAGTFRSNVAGANGGGVFVDGANSSLDAGPAVVMEANSANNGAGLAVSDDALALIRGSVISGNFSQRTGGGIAVTQRATVNLIGAQVSSNVTGTFAANGQGAGIFVDSNAALDIQNSIVSYNGATDSPAGAEHGGGIFAGDGVIVSVNNSTISGNVAISGGGVFASSTNDAIQRTDVSITNSEVTSNLSYSAGGGIYAGAGVDLYLKCANVTNNNVLGGSGGGLYMTGTQVPGHASAVIRYSQLNENTAYFAGGGIASMDGAVLDVENTSVSGNSVAQRGGGVYLSGGSLVAEVNDTTISLSLISGNVVQHPGGLVSGQSGGGVWVGNGVHAEIQSTTIESNSATHGGGLAIQNAGRFRLVNSTVSGNTGEFGGGAAVLRSDATFLQTTFYGNSASSHGGGFYIESSDSHRVDIDHSTISENYAGNPGGAGGGIYAGNNAAVYALQVNLNHTIVSGNHGFSFTGVDEIYDGGTPTGNQLVTAQFSLIRDNANTLFAAGNPDIDGNKIGSPGLPIDAMLQPLGDNGGPTLTMLPANASPAINAGDPLSSGPLPGDQRMLPYKRVAFGQIDMGAVEWQVAPPTPDFNNDGVADCSDINALTAEVVAGTNSPLFDLTGDGLVTFADVEKWLDDAPDVNGIAITHYLPADINLDTVVDGADFLIWNANKFTNNSDWCAGDVNVDGVVNGLDFLVWNQFKFQASPAPDGCGLSRDAGSERMDASVEFDAVGGTETVVLDAAFGEWERLDRTNSLASSVAMAPAPTISRPLNSLVSQSFAEEEDEFSDDAQLDRSFMFV